MLNKTRAIVLHQVKYGETSLIVTLYTERHGRMSCIVSGAKSKKSKIPATLFQPLALLEADFYYRQNRELQRIKEATCPYHYTTIPFNITKSAIAFFLAEVLYLTLREEESNPHLFDFLFQVFQWLDTRKEGIANFHVWFMLRFARYLGILPEEPAEYTGGSPDTDLQLFHHLPSGAENALMRMVGSPDAPPDDLVLSNQHRMLLLDRIIRHYTLHVEGFSRIKTYAVLQELFQ